MKNAKTIRRSSESIPLDEQLEIMSDELELARKWQRPSILLAVYSSKLVLLDARTNLERKIRRSGQKVFSIILNQELFDLPLFITRQPDKEETVYFVSGIMDPGVNSRLVFRALNIRRELLVDHSIRIVFWLSQDEARALPTAAGDFWVFRHRVLEFTAAPLRGRIKRLIKSLDWRYWDAQTLLAEVPAGLALRQQLLREIPEWSNAPSMRIELMLMLAGINWAQTEYKHALEILEIGLGLAWKNKLTRLQARLLAAVGQVRHSQGRDSLASKAFSQSVQLDRGSAAAWAGLASVLHEQGHDQDAMKAGLEAARLDSKIPTSWFLIGDLHLEAGRLDAAVQAYKKGLHLDSGNSGVWEKLGETYRRLRKPGLALESLQNAHRRDPRNSDVLMRLAEVSFELGRFLSATRALYKAARLDPSNPAPWKSLGEIYHANGQLTQARKAYKQALLITPKDTGLLKALDACYLRKPRK